MPTNNDIKESALNLLAKREHSKQELMQKLQYRFKEAADDINSVIEQLIQENQQSDKRFAASFLRNRLAKRHGKNRIIRELKQKGVAPDDIEWALSTEPDVDWFVLAKELKEIKFGISPAIEYKDKAKQFRYLQYKGFSFDEINYATQSDSSST